MLIHACCADCTLNLIQSLKQETKLNLNNLLIYFYNPNIHPESEWHARRTALKETLEPEGYKLAFENWRPKDYFNRIKLLSPQHRLDPQRRCSICYTLRLQTAINYAQKQAIKTVTTTMLTSNYLDQDKIKKIGQSLAKQTGINFFIPQIITYHPSRLGYYKQNYCGCIYSLNEKITEKYYIE